MTNIQPTQFGCSKAPTFGNQIAGPTTTPVVGQAQTSGGAIGADSFTPTANTTSPADNNLNMGSTPTINNVNPINTANPFSAPNNTVNATPLGGPTPYNV